MISWFERHSKISWTITILIAVTIFYLSSISFKTYNVGGIGLQAVFYHILAFFFLAAFLLISLVKGKKKKFIPLGIVLAILYSISDEVHQFFVPGRAMALFDMFLDSTGIIFAAVIYLAFIEHRNGVKKK